MNKFFSLLIILIILFLPTGSLFSQTKMKLTGTVSDSSKPLPLATVRIFKKSNPAPLQTTLTKDNGSFQLIKPEAGDYTLSITHTGFAEKTYHYKCGRARRYASGTNTTNKSNRHA